MDNRDNECTSGKKSDKQKLGADTKSIEKMHRTRFNYLAGSHSQSRIDFNREFLLVYSAMNCDDAGERLAERLPP